MFNLHLIIFLVFFLIIKLQINLKFATLYKNCDFLPKNVQHLKPNELSWAKNHRKYEKMSKKY